MTQSSKKTWPWLWNSLTRWDTSFLYPVDMTGFWLMFGSDIYTKCLRLLLSLNKEAWERSHHIYCLTLTSAFPLQRPSRPKVINNDECGFSLCALSQMESHCDNNSLQARALTWLFKNIPKPIHKKKGTKFCDFLKCICLLNDRFLQQEVTEEDQRCRWEHLSLREMTDSFSTWFSLSVSPFLSKLSFPKLPLPLSPCLSSLAQAGSQHVCLPCSWKYIPQLETVYRLCCILNLLTCDCVHVGLDGGSHPSGLSSERLQVSPWRAWT